MCQGTHSIRYFLMRRMTGPHYPRGAPLEDRWRWRCIAAVASAAALHEMQLPSTERDAKVSTSHFFYPVLPAESRGSLSHVAPLGQANRGSSCTPLWAQPGQALADGSPPLFSRTQATYSSKRLGHGSSSAYPAKFASTWGEGDGEQKKRQPARPTHTEKERRHARRQEDRASRQCSLKRACLWKEESFLQRYSPRDRISR